MFAEGCRPLRLNLNHADLSGGEVTEAGPRPLRGVGHKSALDRIVVHVTDLLHSLSFRVDVEVIVTALPEGPLRALDGDGQLQCLNGFGQ